MPSMKAGHAGGCLCGNIRYRCSGEPSFPHFCSCRMCQRWSGAPVVAWVDFPRGSVIFDGPGGRPRYFRSSKGSRRGSCPKCGGAICALDDGSDKICMTVATLDDPDAIIPASYSYPGAAPAWLEVAATVPEKRRSGARGAARRGR
jgi:hypothetical protein